MSGANGWPCVGGPLDGKMLAHDSDSYEVTRPCAPGMTPNPGGYDNIVPVGLVFERSRYRLMAREHDRFAWVFQGWPE